MDTEHPESLRRIQEIEAVQPAKPSEEEAVPEKPSFTQLLNGPKEVLREGQSVHMDCMVQPINDPNLKVILLLNSTNFGKLAYIILYIYIHIFFPLIFN